MNARLSANDFTTSTSMNERTNERMTLNESERASASDARLGDARARGAREPNESANDARTTCGFRVMRLRASSYDVERDDVGVDFARANEGVWEENASERAKERATTSELALPRAFGQVNLGETFSSYVTFGNFSANEFAIAREVGIKVELQSEKTRTTLYDGTRTPRAALSPGEKCDLIVTKDLKELGAHTLVCSATYFDDSGERKYLPQYFKFKVANPLNVRTKMRSAPRGRALLEVCIENLTKSLLLLEEVRFDAVDGIQSHSMTPEFGGRATRFYGEEDGDGLPSLGRRAVYPLDPSTGAAHYLFEISRIASDDVFELKTPLGKLELRWRGPMGDPGRLQTQIIVAGGAGTTDVKPTAVKITQRVIAHASEPEETHASAVYTETPFVLRATVEGVAEDAQPYILRVKDITSGVYIDGPRARAIGTISRGSVIDVDISCVALGFGVQQCPSLVVVGALDDVVAHAPPPLQIFATRAPSRAS